MMQDSHNSHKYKIAIFVALSCVLQILESLIPHPIPGLRLGLANILSVTALVMLGFRCAMEITILRTLLSSFIMGTFMSPGFILSFSSAVVSTLIMGLLMKVSVLKMRYGLSIIGISISGAFSHNMVQIFLAYLILVKHSGIFVFLPWLSIGAVVMGYVTGLIAGGVCRNLDRYNEMPENYTGQIFASDGIKKQYVHGDSLLHRLPGYIKIMAVVCLSLLMLMIDNLMIYVFMFTGLAMASFLSRTPVSFFINKMRRYSSLILFSFLLPFFFNSGSHTVAIIAHFNITHEGLTTGTVFASRILFLIFSSALLVRTTTSEAMTDGLALLMSPLKYAGVPVQRTAAIMSISWDAVPVLLDATRKAIYTADFKKVKNYRKLIPFLSNLISSLYLEAEKGKQFRK